MGARRDRPGKPSATGALGGRRASSSKAIGVLAPSARGAISWHREPSAGNARQEIITHASKMSTRIEEVLTSRHCDKQVAMVAFVA